MDDMTIDKLKEYCDPIFECDDNSESDSIDFESFSLSPNDIILTDGFINYCYESRYDGKERYTHVVSRYYNASYVCVFDNDSAKCELFISKQKFTEDKVNELYQKIINFINNEEYIRKYLISDNTLPEYFQ